MAVAGLMSPAAHAGGDPKEVISAFNVTPRAVRADHPLLPVHHVGTISHGGSYYVSRHLKALALEHRSFTIRSISEKDDRCELRLESRAEDRLTRVSILVAAEDSAEAADLVPIVLADLFEFGPPVHPHRFLGSRLGEKRFHLAASNHAPAEGDAVPFATAEEASDQGYRPCGICFSISVTPPIPNYPAIRAIALTAAREYELVFPPVADEELQASVQGLGDSLVASLPFEPRGFEYRFRVVEGEFPTASSFATGFVYVSDRLANSLDGRWEQAFILAHEIAHVEMHLPRPDKSEQGDNGPRSLATRRQEEFEADLMAQVSLWKFGVPPAATRHLAISLRKIEYFEADKPSEAKTDKFDTHPSVEERYAAIARPEYSFPSATGCGTDGNGNVLMRGTLLAAECNDKEIVIVVAVEGTVALPRPTKLTKCEVWLSGEWTYFEVQGLDDLAPEGRRLVRARRKPSMKEGYERIWRELTALQGGRLRILTEFAPSPGNREDAGDCDQ